MIDKRIIPGWSTDIKKKRDYILKLEEDNEQMHRQIAHYDDELREARMCIRRIENFCKGVLNSYLSHDRDLIETIDNIINAYKEDFHNYSDNDVKCLYSTIEETNGVIFDNAESIIFNSMKDYI